ncbi:MAG: glycosyltransferase [Patescibacteria group bacterium]|nr:glycosyltransferase [Patescibacteria group bacterium]
MNTPSLKRPCRKIVYLITKSSWGGAQQYVFDLAMGAKRGGFKVAVMTGGYGELVQKLKTNGVQTYLLESLARNVGIIQEINALLEIIRVIKIEQPDVLHLNSSKAGFLGVIVGRWCHVPKIIFTAHGWAFNEARPWWQRVSIKIFHWITVLLAHKTIAVSRAIRSQMNLPFPSQKMVFIHNGREEKKLHTKVEARKILEKHLPTLIAYQQDLWTVTIAELHITKQNSHMITAMKEIIKIYPKARHIIIGDGELYEELSDQIKRTHLTKHIFLIGKLMDAARYLQAFEFMILPSRSEAFPYVLLEACIAGIPSIASNVGGIPEIIRDGQEGILIPANNIQKLIEAYVALIKDKKRREYMTKQAQKRANDFSLQTMLRHTFQQYDLNI